MRNNYYSSLAVNKRVLSGVAYCKREVLSGDAYCTRGVLSGVAYCERGVLSGVAYCTAVDESYRRGGSVMGPRFVAAGRHSQEWFHLPVAVITFGFTTCAAMELFGTLRRLKYFASVLE